MSQSFSSIEYFSPPPKVEEIPDVLFDPFGYEFHPLVKRASEILQSRLQHDVIGAGNMFGVLVVKDDQGRIGFLSAFSNQLPQHLIKDADACFFVPPAFSHEADKTDYKRCFLLSANNEKKSIDALWTSDFVYENLGQCAAIKLFQQANAKGWQALAFAEFWWGRQPVKSIRHHGQYYPACRGKCGPLLSFMLQGRKIRPKESLGLFTADDNAPSLIYEDDDLLVVNKPAGLLSVPGKEVTDSVLTRLQVRYPEATGPLLLHRLDLATSGLLLAAKNKATHKALQKQFMQRTIEKRYVAVLSKPLNASKGTITLPLRVDFEDRPRQLVCYDHGKPATTTWALIEKNAETSRVYLYPLTGRTHQLRLHAAHKTGLNAPIIGDRLYGKVADRLLLHAQQLIFTHPTTGERIQCESPVPF